MMFCVKNLFLIIKTLKLYLNLKRHIVCYYLNFCRRIMYLPTKLVLFLSKFIQIQTRFQVYRLLQIPL